MSHRILIASHTFPPYTGIGGRRWAKFAKYLHRKGNEVSVVCANLGDETNSFWKSDVEGITVTNYTHKFPSILTKSPKGIFEKILYRLALTKMESKSIGTPYDRALLDKEEFLRTMRSEIERFKPNVVVVTGAPFLLLVYTLEIIRNNGNITFVGDLRDPWTWGHSYGYSLLTGNRKEQEKKWEQSVCNEFDLITSPWPEIVSKLKIDYPNHKARIEILSQAYDQEDLPYISQVSRSREKKVLSYGGNLYQGMAPFLKELGRVGKESGKFEVNIYSNKVPELDNAEGLNIMQPLPSQDFFDALSQSDFILFPIGLAIKDGVPTKLFEFGALRKPILAFGNQGLVSSFIEEKSMGVFLNSADEVIAHLDSLEASKDEWFKEFEYQNVTDQLIELISI